MSENNQKQKRILMFCTDFFGYDKRIANALRDTGYVVDLYDERPGKSFFHKSCIRLNVSLYRPVIIRYIRSIIAEVSHRQYDYILVIKGEGITQGAIKLLRESFPDAKTILYLWDSVRNIPDCEDRMCYYDRVFTFDPEDAACFHLPYLPLPYDNSVFMFAEKVQFEYDVAFVGTAHSVRPRVVKQVAEQCKMMGRKCYYYFYCPHPLVFLYNKMTNPDFRYLSKKEVNFRALSTDQIHEIYQKSRCILDVEHPKQSGATTRPIEMLPMKKKVITTNPKVKDFPFYRPENFLLIRRDCVELDPKFFETEYSVIPQEMIRQYSPEKFANHLMQNDVSLFSEENHNEVQSV